MEFNFLKYTGRFILILGIQVVILNQIYLGGFITPYFYPLFILLLPFDTKGYNLLLVAFIVGLTMDMFSDSLGMHASATVLMAFMRPFIIQLISVKTDFEQGTEPRMGIMGSGWIFMYTIILIFIHHLSLFMLEIFRFTEFGQTLLRTLLSTIASVALIMLAHLLLSNPRKSRTS